MKHYYCDKRNYGFGPGFSRFYIDTYKYVYLEFNAWWGKI